MKFLFAFCICLFSTALNAQKILDDIAEGNVENVQKWLAKTDQLTTTFKKTDQSSTQTIDVNIIEWAAFHNQLEILELLVENKTKFPNFNQWINTALGASIHNCNFSLFQLIVEQGAKLDYACQMCNSSPPVAIALSYKCDEIYSFLRDNNVPLTTPGSGFDVIHSVAAASSLEQLKELVEKERLDVNQKGRNNFTPLFAAAEKGKVENIQYLISKGAILTEKDAEGLTLLHYANDKETFIFLEEKLIKSGLMTIEAIDKSFPLFMAVIESDNKELFDYVLANYKQLLKSKDKERRNITMSLLYTEENTAYFYKQLKANKVNFSNEDKYGKDLKYYAKKMKRTELLDLFND
jgi:ankyrin repeat protein